jgi:hypothetical protein
MKNAIAGIAAFVAAQYVAALSPVDGTVRMEQPNSERSRSVSERRSEASPDRQAAVASAEAAASGEAEPAPVTHAAEAK